MTTTPTLDPDAYRRGWNDSANGAPARVPAEYETDATINGYVWGWFDYVLAMNSRLTKGQEGDAHNKTMYT